MKQEFFGGADRYGQDRERHGDKHVKRDDEPLEEAKAPVQAEQEAKSNTR